MGRSVNPDSFQDHPSKSDRGPKSGGRGPQSSQSRPVLISKALSRLLRHQAENERIPITNDGWVRLDHVLAWRGFTGRNGVTGGPVTVEDVWSVVEENEKKRFAVRLVTHEKGRGERVRSEDVGAMEGDQARQPETTVGELVGGDSTMVEATKADQMPSGQDSRAVIEKAKSTGLTAGSSTEAGTLETERSESETAQAISYFRTTSPAPPASEFLIRATQGHSIKTIASDTALLTPITNSDPDTVPTTCVHGTFYGSWPAILATGGLKRMGRNHVHFAEGPTLAELGLDESGKKMNQFVGERKEVISGMRRDAQLLIYVDVKAALEGDADMTWWRSENGVILTEGVEAPKPGTRNDEQDATMHDNDDASEQPSSPVETQTTNSSSSITQVAQQIADANSKFTGPNDWKAKRQQGQGKNAQAAAQSDKMVPMKYWTLVVDAKGSRDIIWRRGEGIVKELPESLVNRGPPKGKGRGGGRGRGR